MIPRDIFNIIFRKYEYRGIWEFEHLTFSAQKLQYKQRRWFSLHNPTMIDCLINEGFIYSYEYKNNNAEPYDICTLEIAPEHTDMINNLLELLISNDTGNNDLGYQVFQNIGLYETYNDIPHKERNANAVMLRRKRKKECEILRAKISRKEYELQELRKKRDEISLS